MNRKQISVTPDQAQEIYWAINGLGQCPAELRTFFKSRYEVTTPEGLNKIDYAKTYFKKDGYFTLVELANDWKKQLKVFEKMA